GVGVVALPLALPILPIAAAGSGPIAAVNKELRESYGWPQFVQIVASVPGQIVLTSNYGEAGALQRFAPGRSVYSGHNSYWLWGPPPDAASGLVVVGQYSSAWLDDHFRGCERRATISNPARVPNDEQGPGGTPSDSPAR